MTLALTPHNRLAAPTGSAPMAPLPPQPPSINVLQTSFGDPFGVDREPSYLATAREHARLFGDSPVAVVRLAQAEESAKETEAAVRTAGRALQLALDQRDNSAAFAAGQLLLANGSGDTAYALLRGKAGGDALADLAAKSAIACGKYGEAARLLTGSETLEGLSLRGWLALENGRPRDAVHLLRKAVRLHGGTPALFTNIGFGHAQLGELTKAIRETRQALALAPGNRAVAFNLMGFLSADGRRDEALAVLDDLEKIYPADIEIALARADVFLRFGDRQAAHRTLQRARTSSGMVVASRAARAELDANLAFLRWLTGRRDVAATRKIVLEQFAISDYESLPIVGLLPALLQESSDAALIDSLLTRLEAVHPAEDILFLKVHHAIVCRDGVRAVQLARAWAEHEPLNSLAASVAVQLSAELAGDWEGAIKLGREALRSAPRDAALINNLAYVLACAGELAEARELLAHVSFENHIALTATRALVNLLSGSIEDGLAGYRRAKALAVERNHRGAAWLTEAYCALALRQLDPRVLAEHGLSAPDRLVIPPEVGDNVNVWIFRHRAEREGLSLVATEEDG